MTSRDKEREEARRRAMEYQRERREAGERQHTVNQPAVTFIPAPSLRAPQTPLHRRAPRRNRTDSQTAHPVFYEIFPL